MHFLQLCEIIGSGTTTGCIIGAEVKIATESSHKNVCVAFLICFSAVNA